MKLLYSACLETAEMCKMEFVTTFDSNSDNLTRLVFMLTSLVLSDPPQIACLSHSVGITSCSYMFYISPRDR